MLFPVAKNQLTFGLLPYNNPVTCTYSMRMPITSTYDYFSLPFFLQCLLGFFSNKFILISTIDVGRYPIIWWTWPINQNRMWLNLTSNLIKNNILKHCQSSLYGNKWKKMNRLLLKNYSVKTHNKITNDHYIFFLRGKAVNKANRL